MQTNPMDQASGGSLQVGIDVGQLSRTITKIGQVPKALQDLREMLNAIDGAAGRLIAACEPGMQPEADTAMVGRLDSTPRDPVAPLVVVIEELCEHAVRISGKLSSAADRAQLA